jgi:hypothetical protein
MIDYAFLVRARGARFDIALDVMLAGARIGVSFAVCSPIV